MHPLVVEAMKKAAVAWLTVDDRPAYAVWCLWVDDALYVVSGPASRPEGSGPASRPEGSGQDEQPAPGLAAASTALVSARGDHGGRIVTWRATVSRVEPDSEQWSTVVPQLAAKRLNSLAGPELGERWARDCVLSRLEPTDDLSEIPDGSFAAPPRPTPAARVTRKPFRLHKVRDNGTNR